MFEKLLTMTRLRIGIRHDLRYYRFVFDDHGVDNQILNVRKLHIEEINSLIDVRKKRCSDDLFVLDDTGK